MFFNAQLSSDLHLAGEEATTEVTHSSSIEKEVSWQNQKVQGSCNIRGYITCIWDEYLYMLRVLHDWHGFAVWICFSTMKYVGEIFARSWNDTVTGGNRRINWAFLSLQHFYRYTIVYQRLQRWMTIRLHTLLPRGVTMLIIATYFSCPRRDLYHVVWFRFDRVVK